MEYFYLLINKIFGKPKETRNTSTIIVFLLWALRIFVFYQALHQILFGERGFGFITLLCFFAITVPKYVTKGVIKRFPVEIELMLFIIVLLQYVIGEAKNFYRDVPYFDKFVHFTIPFLIAVLNYSLFYTMHAIGKLKTSIFNVFLLVVFITLGVGALWEIVEYSTDTFLVEPFKIGHRFQGSIVESPFYDTMNDLVADFVGGVLGAAFSVFFLLRDRKKGRTKELVNEISAQVFKKRVSK